MLKLVHLPLTSACHLKLRCRPVSYIDFDGAHARVSLLVFKGEAGVVTVPELLHNRQESIEVGCNLTIDVGDPLHRPDAMLVAGGSECPS